MTAAIYSSSLLLSQ